MPAPSEESEVRAQETRRDIEGHERRLDRQRPGPAQRIRERRARLGKRGPAGREQEGGGQVLLERGRAALLSVAAAVQGLAGEIDAEARLIAVQIHMDAHIRPLAIDRGTLAMPFAELVHDGVLDLERPELRVGDGGIDRLEPHRQGPRRRQMLVPVDGPHPFVQGLGRGRREARDGPQDAAREPRPEARAVGRGEVAFEVHPRAPRPYRSRAEGSQLAREQPFHALGRGGEER